VLADCSCSRTPVTSLAMALCSVSCSRTPGTSLAMARAVLAHLAPLLLLLVVLTHVLAQLGLCMHCVFAQCWMIAHILAQLGVCMHCVFAQCRMIAPTSSLQERHAFVLAEEPWLVSLLV